jgi:hypothetical protein
MERSLQNGPKLDALSRDLYFDRDSIFILPPPFPKMIFLPLLRHFVFLLLLCPFCLHSSLFCIYLPFYFRFSLFLSPLSSFIFSPIFLFLFSTSASISPPGEGGVFPPIYRPLTLSNVQDPTLQNEDNQSDDPVSRSFF